MTTFIIHIVLLLTLPPLLPGVINKTKALFAGRRGPPLLQLYYDLFKLARKDMVISRVTTWIFTAARLILFWKNLDCAKVLLIAKPPTWLTADWLEVLVMAKITRVSEQ